MSTDGLQPVLVDQYGGLCTLIDRSDLPVGLSPDCQHVEFFPGGVRSRSGFSSYGGGSSVESLYSYVASPGLASQYLLCLSGSGTFQAGVPGAAPGNVSFGGYFATSTDMTVRRIRGTTMFGRAYLGFYGWPRDNTTPVTRIDIPTGPFQYTSQTGLTAIAPAGPCASFTVANAAGGTMAAGRHDFCVVYETATEYVTQISDTVGLTVTGGSGNYAVNFAALPIGIGAVTRRVVFATPANSSSFFSLPRFAVSDNATTTIAGLTFTDSELMAGTSLEDYIDRVSPNGVMGIEKYGSRLVYWGGVTNALNPFLDTDTATGYPRLIGLQSLSFNERASALPYPWVTAAGAPGAGGAITTKAGAMGQVYSIAGDGASAVRGRIAQTPQPGIGGSGTYYLVPGKVYSIRARVSRNSAAVVPDLLSLNITLNAIGPTSGTTAIATITANATAVTESWAILTGGGTVVVPSDAVQVGMQIDLSGTADATRTVYVDWVEVIDGVAGNADSVLAISPPDDPETINPTTGLVAVAEGDGQRIRDVFQLRGNLYVCKDNSMYVVTDNGGDPYEWPVDIVSSTVGTSSPHGVAVGDGWALIAHRTGLYHFTGGVPEKISQEIQPTWDAVDWGWAIRTWVTIDPALKRVYVGVVNSGGTAGSVRYVNRIFVLDYVEGFSDPIAGGGSGRKWTYWDMYAEAGIMADTNDLTSVFVKADGTAIFRYVSGTVADGTTPIESYYETAPIGTEIGRSLFDRLVMRIRGSGSLVAKSRVPGGTLTTLPTKTLASSPNDDVEIKIHENQTQVGFRIGTTGATDYWSLRRLGVFIKPAVFSYLRKT